ncbi:MAG TPA: hypothetical protein VLJ68_09905 [Chitinophagaceae bacterium]|nr:hypothetical protein [Chitinophagaceae bacterium]
MKFQGRPRSGPVQLKNGFYIEVCNLGVKSGVKIWCADKKAMEDAARQNGKYKNVILLGEYKDGKPFNAVAVK